MVRIRPLLAPLALVLALAAPGQAQHPDELPRTIRLYDAREVAAILPPPPRTPLGTFSREPTFTMHGATDLFSAQTRPEAPPDARTEATRLVVQLAVANEMNEQMVFDHIVSIGGTAAQHARLAAQLEQLQALYRDQAEIELVCYETDADEAPRVGAPVGPDDPMVTVRTSVLRRQSTPVESIRRRTFVEDVTAIVGEGAQAYDPRMAELRDGLSVSVIVGSPAGGTATPLRIQGEIARVTLHATATADHFDGHIPMLPTFLTRSIDSHVSVPEERLVAVSVVEGFEAGRVIVVAAAVRTLE